MPRKRRVHAHTAEHVSNLRERAVTDGRAMIRVRYTDTGELSTAAVCPGCWNDPERRRAILARMNKMHATVLSERDGLNGVYLTGKRHMPSCPYRNRTDAWERFRRQMKRR
jgi:hypothetical protein